MVVNDCILEVCEYWQRVNIYLLLLTYTLLYYHFITCIRECIKTLCTALYTVVCFPRNGSGGITDLKISITLPIC